MTDELKHKFEALVSDAPAPSGVPSEAVFERVRAVKRRRTATAGILATAAVVAAAIAAGNLANLNSAPLPATTPSPTPIVTHSPTVAPSTTPTSKQTIGGSVNTLPPVGTTDESGTPSSNDPSSPGTSGPDPVKLNLSLETTYKNQKLTVKVRKWGSLLEPLFQGKPLPAGTRFQDAAFNYAWDWGDGTYDPPQGVNGSGLSCDGATKRRVGDVTTATPLTHTYTKPGTFTFEYVLSYCGPNGLQTVKKTKTVTADQPFDY